MYVTPLETCAHIYLFKTNAFTSELLINDSNYNNHLVNELYVIRS